MNVSNMKFILFCFEAMSGMKINYNKSEIFGFGIDTELQEEVARIFGCRVGKLPMIYLGLPVNDIKISKAQFSYVSDKANKSLATWKCDTLSSGGKLRSLTHVCPAYQCTQWEYTNCMKAISRL